MNNKHIHFNTSNGEVCITELGWRIILKALNDFQRDIREEFDLPAEIEIVPHYFFNDSTIRCHLEKEITKYVAPNNHLINRIQDFLSDLAVKERKDVGR